MEFNSSLVRYYYNSPYLAYISLVCNLTSHNTPTQFRLLILFYMTVLFSVYQLELFVFRLRHIKDGLN